METIRKWHTDKKPKGNGWKDIGYHYIVELDGEVRRGRPVDEIGAHCAGQNADSIGVCYVGGLDKHGKIAKDTRTVEQKRAMFMLVKRLMEEYGLGLDDVYCHNQWAAKACPSFKIETFRGEFEAFFGR